MSAIISLPNSISANIDSLQAGGLVIGYSIPHATYSKVGRKILEIKSEGYNGTKITVSAKTGQASSYTTDHTCLIKFPTDDRHLVYIMRRKNDYRIGIAKMRYECGFGPLARLRSEKGDAVWVLKAFENRMDALIAEQIISTKFKISQLTFIQPNKLVSGGFTDEILDIMWAEIGNNRDEAELCLASFGRDIRYPMATKGENYASRRPVATKACNLFDGMQVRVYTGDTHARFWTPVTISRDNCCENITSILIENDNTYVADGIVTFSGIENMATI